MEPNSRIYNVFNLDSNKITASLSGIPLNGSEYHYNLPYGKTLLSPKGTYFLLLLSNTDDEDDNYPMIRNYVLNTSDLSVKLKLWDGFNLHYDAYTDSTTYTYATFNDDETKLALIPYNYKLIDIYDLTSNSIYKRIYTGLDLYNTSKTIFEFDSTGKYLIIGMIDPIYQRVFINIETGNIDFMTDLFPPLPQRGINTNAYYSDEGFTYSKIRINELSSAIDEIFANKCEISINSNNMSITSAEPIEISKICIFDVKGRFAFY